LYSFLISKVGNLHTTNLEVIVDSFCAFENLSLHDGVGVSLCFDAKLLLFVFEFLFLSNILQFNGIFKLQFGGLKLSLLHFSDLILLGYLLLHLVKLFISVEFHSCFIKVHVHWSLSNSFVVFCLLLLKLNLHLFLGNLSILLLDCKSLLILLDPLCGVIFSSDLLIFSVSNQTILVDCLLHFSRDLVCLLSFVFSEWCLQVLEKTCWSNGYILDFTCFKPDTPTCQNFLHFLFDTISELVSVLQHIIDGHVSNFISDNGDSHCFNFFVGNSWRGSLQIFTKTFETSKRSIFLPVYTPNTHTWNFNTLHLICNLVRSEGDLVNETWEGNDLISWHCPSTKPNSTFVHCTISNNDHPFICSCFLKEL